jgi:hypothetical protein
VKRADAICSAYNSQVTLTVVTPRSYRAVEAYTKRTLPLYEAALRKLSALHPSSTDAGAVRRWLAADRRVARAVHDLGLAARRRDFPGVSAAASRAQIAGDQSRQAAIGLGMQVCALVHAAGS